MPSFNKAIKRTTLIELLIIILCFYSVYMVASFYGFNVDMEWMYVAIIAYILIKSLIRISFLKLNFDMCF